ncbi:multicopper oxidase family protein [Candidatus Woesearchaeota archaeon]|nr:multicopper oxidase family protein [Candidatus Woesearchaeota archaeon]
MRKLNLKHKLAAVLIILSFLLAACSQANNTMADHMMPTREISDAKVIDRSVSSLSEARQSEIVELKDKQVLQLEANPVVKEIDGNKIRMYAYNGQIPGPFIKAKQGSIVYVNFTNNIDAETTIHWHGIRLDTKFDGVVDISQKPVKPGESFLYEIKLPDEGIYWYHPHMREDLQQELGLYGNIFIEPKDEDYFNKVNMEVALFLDDIKMKGNDIEPFNNNFATFTMMGRFGNVMLVNGETDYKLNAKKGDIARFYLTDSANTRTFNFMIEDHKLKLIGSDSGKYEKESIVDSIIMASGERYIAEALFDKPGTYKIIHKTPQKEYTLGEIIVENSDIIPEDSFYELKENRDIEQSIEPFKKYLSPKPDYEFRLDVEQSAMGGGMGRMSDNEEIEWDDAGHNAMMNSMSTSKNVKWIIKDEKTGKINMENNYNVKVGDVKKIRFVNSKNSKHPMQHPMHLHGQRFLVLSIDGKQNENLAWKDTVLVPAGKTVDILVEFSNPGEWVMHCHIAEHLEAGMMTQFTVS